MIVIKPITTHAEAWEALLQCLDRAKPGCSVVVPVNVVCMLLHEHSQAEQETDVTD